MECVGVEQFLSLSRKRQKTDLPSAPNFFQGLGKNIYPLQPMVH